MSDHRIEVEAVIGVAAELMASGDKECAKNLLMHAVEPLRKSADEAFLYDAALAAKAVALEKSIPFSYEVQQQGEQRRWLFKCGGVSLEHSQHGRHVSLTIRKGDDSDPKHIALAKAIQVKLQRSYAERGEVLAKGDLEKRSKNVRRQTRSIGLHSQIKRLKQFSTKHGINLDTGSENNGDMGARSGKNVNRVVAESRGGIGIPHREIALHELGHAISMPKGRSLHEHQRIMDRMGDRGDIDESVVLGLESKIARRAGVKPPDTRGKYQYDRGSAAYIHTNQPGVKNRVKLVTQQLDMGQRKINPKTGRMSKAKIDEWRTRDIIPSKTPKVKRKLRQTRAEAPEDPLAAKMKKSESQKLQWETVPSDHYLQTKGETMQQAHTSAGTFQYHQHGDFGPHMLSFVPHGGHGGNHLHEAGADEVDDDYEDPEDEIRGVAQQHHNRDARQGHFALTHHDVKAIRTAWPERGLHHLEGAHPDMVRAQLKRAHEHLDKSWHDDVNSSDPGLLHYSGKTNPHLPGPSFGPAAAAERKEAKQIVANSPGAKAKAKVTAALARFKKSNVIQLDQSKRRKPVEASAPGEAKGPIARLLPPEEHRSAAYHHVLHTMHHNAHADLFAPGHPHHALHQKLAEQHYQHALGHAKRFGQDKHWVAFMQGELERERGGKDPFHMIGHSKREFTPHNHDSALGPSRIAKSNRFFTDLAKALTRVERSKRKALGRKRSRGVWARSGKVPGHRSALRGGHRPGARGGQIPGGAYGGLAQNPPTKG